MTLNLIMTPNFMTNDLVSHDSTTFIYNKFIVMTLDLMTFNNLLIKIDLMNFNFLAGNFVKIYFTVHDLPYSDFKTI